MNNRRWKSPSPTHRFALRLMFAFLMVTAFAASNAATTLALSPAAVTGGATLTATVTIDAPATGSGVIVTIASNNAAAKVPASTIIAAGQNSASFAISTDRVDTQILATISATVNGAAVTSVLTINPVSLAGFSVTPNSITGGQPCAGTLTLSGPAGPNGVVVAVSSNTAAANVPGKVTIPPGQTTATFPVQTKVLSQKVEATLSASLGLVSTTASVSIFPEGPLSVTLAPPAVNGGEPCTGTVTLTGPAPTGGLVLSLTANNKTITLPVSVKVEAGATTATFSIKTVKVASVHSVLISARFKDQAQNVTLSVSPPGISTIVLSSTSVPGGVSSGGTITLAEPAPAGGLKIAMSSDNAAAVVPAQLLVPAGKTTASFSVRTVAVAAQVVANVKAVVGNVPKQVALTIAAPTLVSIVLGSPVVDGGSTSDATINLGSPAPAAGLVISVTCNQKAVLLAPKITIDAGRTSGWFRIHTTKVAAQTVATITATFGAGSQTATLTIN